jgi:hypothetical protein
VGRATATASLPGGETRGSEVEVEVDARHPADAHFSRFREAREAPASASLTAVVDGQQEHALGFGHGGRDGTAFSGVCEERREE